MTLVQKFRLSFLLALTLHLTILVFFGLDFSSDSDTVNVKPLPEIIQASILDDEKIQQEAIRLKKKEENTFKKEQQRLQSATKKRKQDERKAKALAKKVKDLDLETKQKQERINKQNAIEVAYKAKIKKQKEDAIKKRKEAEIVEQKRQKVLMAKQKAIEAEHNAKIKKQQEDEDNKRKEIQIAEQQQRQALIAKQQTEAAKAQQDKQAIISATVAIQQKVINRWIKPISSVKGLSCNVRVELLSSGDVMNVSIINSSGDSIFDRSAENAVRKASPLPVPKNRALFAKKFRKFTFNFKPEK